MEGMPEQLVAERGDVASARDAHSDAVTGSGGGEEGHGATGPSGVSGWLRRGGRPWWSTPAMVLIGVLAGVLYLHRLSTNTMSNTFYAAAVKSGTESWKAFFFGSLDQSSFITVDKPPASLWVMEISGRIFGFSSLSMLVPIALAGALVVVVIFHLVRRWMGDVAAVLAATALAVTPVFTAIFRSDEPDAIMTLFLVLAAWALWSALETGATSRLLICSGLLGMAFLTKMLEAFVVVPAFVLAYLLFGPPKLGCRLVQLVWGVLALVIASGWWVAVVELWPTASRPYIDSSGDNSELSLIFGYNGFGRLLGTSRSFRGESVRSSASFRGGGPVRSSAHGFSGGFASASHFGSQPGWQRMFAPALGSQISWLIPVAGLGLVAGLWASRRAPRSDLVRAGFAFWGVWATCAIVVLSSVQGTFHTYYVVETAPALAALAAGGALVMWRMGRASRLYSWVLPLGVLASALWAAHLLERVPNYAPGLARAVEVTGVIGAIVLFVTLVGGNSLPRLGLVAAAAVGGVAAVIAAFAGPMAYSLWTVQNSTTATNPTGGPTATSTTPGLPGRFNNPALTKILARLEQLAAAEAAANGGVAPVSGVSSGMIGYLKAHRDGADWIVAVGGSTTAAPLILISGEPVMSMGGFTGSEPVPTLAQFEQLVAGGKIHYVLVNGGFGGFGRFGGFGGFGGAGTSAAGAVDRLALQFGEQVPASAYGGSGTGSSLYYLSAGHDHSG
jgi:4-amino-4-deoxy-L-arabinose transferase-like glycosyltransferase